MLLLLPASVMPDSIRLSIQPGSTIPATISKPPVRLGPTALAVAESGNETCPGPRLIRDNRFRSLFGPEIIFAVSRAPVRPSDRQTLAAKRSCSRCKNWRSSLVKPNLRAPFSPASATRKLPGAGHQFSSNASAQDFPVTPCNSGCRAFPPPPLRPHARGQNAPDRQYDHRYRRLRSPGPAKGSGAPPDNRAGVLQSDRASNAGYDFRSEDTIRSSATRPPRLLQLSRLPKSSADKKPEPPGFRRRGWALLHRDRRADICRPRRCNPNPRWQDAVVYFSLEKSARDPGTTVRWSGRDEK